MSPRTARNARTVPALLTVLPLLALLNLGALGCGGPEEPGAPEPPPPPPELTGALIMLLPTQGRPSLDSELAFWLEERAPRTTWLLPDRLQPVVDRSPGWRVRLDALPPGYIEVGGQRRLTGDLYNNLRRLGAMLDARIALIPYVGPVADSGGTAIEVTGVLVDVVGGRVVWHGTVRSAFAPGVTPPSPASAAQALARALAPL